jgi:hypothetical protein
MAEEVGIAPTIGQTCSRFQGGALVYPDSLQQNEMVRAPGNAPGPGTHLVRLRL